MKPTHTISLPTLMLVAATRAMLGAGIGLLVAERLGERRVPVGRALVALGALSTIPLVRHIFGQPPADDYVDPERFRRVAESLH
jgi:hypothetical protein